MMLATAMPSKWKSIDMKAFGRLFIAEVRRYLAESRFYWANYVTDWIGTALIIAVFALSSSDRSDGAYWVGLFLWTAVSNIIQEACISISSDKQSGTFRQLMVRPTPMLTQITVKTLAWSAVNISIYLLFCVILFPLLGFSLGMTWPALLVIVMVFIGSFGFTLLFSALTIVYTKVASAESLIGYVLLLLSGAVLPLSMLPGWLAWIGRLLPTTLGIGMARDSIHGLSPNAWQWGTLTLQSAIFLLAGYVSFRLVIRHGRKRGISMRY